MKIWPSSTSPMGAWRTSELFVSKVIGMNLSIVDGDSVPEAAGNTYYRLSPAQLTFVDAGSFVDVVLIGAGGAGSSVGSVTWARIKASFR